MKINQIEKQGFLAQLNNFAKMLNFTFLFSMFYSAILLLFMAEVLSYEVFTHIDIGLSLFSLSFVFLFSLWYFCISLKKLVIKKLSGRRFLRINEITVVTVVSSFLMAFCVEEMLDLIQYAPKSSLDAISAFIGVTSVLMAFVIRMRDKKTIYFKDMMMVKVKITFSGNQPIYVNFNESGYNKVTAYISNVFLLVTLTIVILNICY